MRICTSCTISRLLTRDVKLTFFFFFLIKERWKTSVDLAAYIYIYIYNIHSIPAFLTTSSEILLHFQSFVFAELGIKWGVQLGSIKSSFCSVWSCILNFPFHHLSLLPCLQCHHALLYSILVSLFLLTNLLLSIILLILKQPVGGRISTVAVGMGSSVTKTKAMWLAWTLLPVGFLATFIPTVPCFFFPISGGWTSLTMTSMTP